MNITYYPVDPVIYTPLPGADPSYPGKPKNAATPVPITILDLVLHTRLNASETYDIPVSLDWLEGFFESFTEQDAVANLCARPYGALHQDFTSTFSKLLGVGLSLAIATKQENFTFFLPLRCCVGTQSRMYGGRHKWPLYIAHTIPHAWCFEKLSLPEYEEVLMPDLVLVDWDPADNPRFSVLEAKGKDKPIDTDAYFEYPKWKHQAENARLVAVRSLGAPATPPLVFRKILSVVAVRPKLKFQDGRKIQCRWFNERNDENVRIPNAWALEAIAIHYSYCVRKLGFYELSDAIDAALLRLEVPANLAAMAPSHPKLRGMRFPPRIPHDELVPFMTLETLKLIRMLVDRLAGPADEGADASVIAAARAHTHLDHTENLTKFRDGHISILPSGIGIAKIGRHWFMHIRWPQAVR